MTKAYFLFSLYGFTLIPPKFDRDFQEAIKSRIPSGYRSWDYPMFWTFSIEVLDVVRQLVTKHFPNAYQQDFIDCRECGSCHCEYNELPDGMIEYTDATLIHSGYEMYVRPKKV